MTRFATRNDNRFAPRHRGFTLTEVLLVLAILGVIAAMVVPNLLGRQKEAMIKITKGSIKSLEDACDQFAVSHDGEFPAGVGDLMNPGVDRDQKPISPYLKSIPKDAWNRDLHYEWPNSKSPNPTGPAIWSYGPDGANNDGGGDDINNWTK